LTGRHWLTWIAEACGIAGKTFAGWHPSGHFSQGEHDKSDDETDEGVRYQQRAWPGGRERLASANDQAST